MKFTQIYKNLIRVRAPFEVFHVVGVAQADGKTLELSGRQLFRGVSPVIDGRPICCIIIGHHCVVIVRM